MKKSILKFLETFSLVGFGLAYWIYDLRVATAVLMALSTAFVVVAILLRERLNPLQWGTWLVVMVLGALSALTEDENLIKLKPSILNVTLALAFGISHWIGEKTLLERLLDPHFPTPAGKLRKVSLACVIYFLLIAGLNLFVAYRFDTSFWVKFKLIGLFVFNGVFLSGCLYYLWEEFKQYAETKERTRKE
jgi:intracellular septation protein